ncbi:methyltransferase domain-containing protein [Saccharopolyspora hattusasensis]|uniref:methyltransferase domain-containing protein n=1 Tax=Saccharopolyspora hattusasensis TaxID=1128679 RepID=UPI003D971A51
MSSRRYLPTDPWTSEVPREPFIPDRIWVYSEPNGGRDLIEIDRVTDPERWSAEVAANVPIITQVNMGKPIEPGETLVPTSSCSMPSLVTDMVDALGPQPGDGILEIGAGTGWNAARLAVRVGGGGHVVTVEVDPELAETARKNLAEFGSTACVVTADGLQGCAEHAPYERIIATCAIRERIPLAWLEQLTPGGRIIAPWGTEFFTGCMLTADADDEGSVTGRFSGDLAFMRARSQLHAFYDYEPAIEVKRSAPWETTSHIGTETLDAVLDPSRARFAISTRVPDIGLTIAWDLFGDRHHSIELDDWATKSWAQLAAHMDSGEPYEVRQHGPRRLWDEVEAALTWWHDHDQPGMDRFGITTCRSDGRQWLWLDDPDHLISNLRMPRPSGWGGADPACRSRSDR